MNEKKNTKRYLVFYDVNDKDDNHVCGTHPVEMPCNEEALKVLVEKNVPINKVYCLSDNYSHFPDMEMFADDYNHEEIISADWWCITIESTDEKIMELWREDEEDDEYPSAEEEALWDENVNKLSKCQVIGQDHELYDWLNELEDADIREINEILAERRYTLTYNNIDDCYVVS